MISLLRDPTLLKSRSYASGTWCEGTSGEIIDVKDPADGSSIGSVPAFSATEVERAIAFASDAMTSWKMLPAAKRAALLRRWHELVTEAADDLSVLITAELGKPLAEARGEVAYAASYIEWYAAEATRIDGEVIPGPSPDKRVLVLKEPVGLCAAITPWNFPAAMVTRKVAPALAAGCAILVKPASQTPLTCLALAELALRAGIPAGLFSVLTGKSSVIGPVLTGSPVIRKLSFTGSSDVGKKLMRDSAATMKRVTMELGGNAPFIVFDDADLEAAVEGLMASKFRGSGQTCVCANRILVHHSVAERFTALLTTAMEHLIVGPGTQEGVTQGPLIDEAAVAKVERLIADATANGATIVSGGKRHALGGTFFEPTLLTGCTTAMEIARAEIFGPVAPIFVFRTDEEAITLANATPYGLAGYFYSRDIARVWRVAEALECGMVGVNTGIISNAAAPFGGIKESGFGREGSSHGISDYLLLKYVCMGGLE
ncbi:MAG: NAD-dependent succinate-semialdehyde dehydrogenase [Chthoniobacterales bacterium]